MKPWTLSGDLYKNRKCMCGFLQRLHLAYTIKQVLNIEFVHSQIDKQLSKQPLQPATAHAKILFDGTLMLLFFRMKKNIYENMGITIRWLNSMQIITKHFTLKRVSNSIFLIFLFFSVYTVNHIKANELTADCIMQ